MPEVVQPGEERIGALFIDGGIQSRLNRFASGKPQYCLAGPPNTGQINTREVAIVMGVNVSKYQSIEGLYRGCCTFSTSSHSIMAYRSSQSSAGVLP